MIPRTIVRKASRLATTVALAQCNWKVRLPFDVSTIATSNV